MSLERKTPADQRLRLLLSALVTA